MPTLELSYVAKRAARLPQPRQARLIRLTRIETRILKAILCGLTLLDHHALIRGPAGTVGGFRGSDVPDITFDHDMGLFDLVDVLYAFSLLNATKIRRVVQTQLVVLNEVQRRLMDQIQGHYVRAVALQVHVLVVHR